MASLSPMAANRIGLLPAERRRHLVLHLPCWATDCLRRAEPGLARPLALWEKQKNAMQVVAVDALAARHGISAGQNLADARALLPDLDAREIDRAALTHLFSEFADWHSNASPLVAVLADQATYGDLCLDITGVAHLFRGEAAMLETLLGRLRVLGFTVTGAIADTIGAAWALAHFAPDGIVARDGLDAALAGLPVAALRLADETVAALTALGLKQVGQLYGRDRKALQARFGAMLVTRLDQALGIVEERLTPRLPVAEYFAERRFAEPIGLIDDVLMCADDLAVQLAGRLAAAARGAQAFHLFLYLVDHKVVSLSVNAARATRDPSHIASLFKHRAERLAGEYDPGFGIDLIRLGASSLSEQESTQLGAFGTIDGAADLERLFDRMASRLGPFAVLRSRALDTHIPERAIRLEPVVAATPDEPVTPLHHEARRPLRLLPEPEPVTVIAAVPDGPPLSMVWRRVRYRFGKVTGPERIEAEWWRSGQRLELVNRVPAEEPTETGEGGPLPPPSPHLPALDVFRPDSVLRDYYVAEDETGRRFWLFRQGLYNRAAAPSWFMHGMFA